MTQQDNAQSIRSDAAPTVTGGPEPDQGVAYPSPASSILDSRAVPIGHIFTWIADAWGLCKQRPGAWLGFALFCAGVCIGVSTGRPGVTSNVIFTFIFMACFHVVFVGCAANFCDLNRRKQGLVPFWSFLVIRRHLPGLPPSHGKSGLAQICANFFTNAGFSPSYGKSGLVGTFYYVLEILFSPLLIVALYPYVLLYLLPRCLFSDWFPQFLSLTLTDMFSQLSSISVLSSTGMMYAFVILLWTIFIASICFCNIYFFFYPVLTMLHNINHMDEGIVIINLSAVSKNISCIIMLCFVTNILLGTIAFILHQMATMPVSMYYILSCAGVVLLFCPYTFMLICSYTAYLDIFSNKKHEQHT